MNLEQIDTSTTAGKVVPERCPVCGAHWAVHSAYTCAGGFQVTAPTSPGRGE